MSAHFPGHLTGVKPSADIRAIGCVREPFDRFLSVYNMTVLNGFFRHNRWGRLKPGFDSDWLHRWFPDPKTIDDPVGFAEQWLIHAAPALDHWGGDLHVMSQSRCFRNFLGPNWQNRTNLQLVTQRNWARLIRDNLGVDYTVHNRAVYTVDKTRFASLRSKVYEIWSDDVQLYRDTARVQG